MCRKINGVALLLLAGICLTGCIGRETPTFEEKWNPVLKLLNVPVAKETSLYPHTHSSEEDLLTKNEDELREISDRWKALRGSRDDKSKTTRDQRNRYFHEQVSLLNQDALGKLARVGALPGAPDREGLAQEILQKVAKSQVASLENVRMYPRGGEIGFCFGRALYIHYLLVKAGVPQEQLIKIFTLGELLVGGQVWRFHVALAVRDKKAGFLVLDPLQSKPIPYGDWLKVVSKYDIKGPFSRSRFYVTEPRKFLPAFPEHDLKQLGDPHLKPYFEALVDELNR